MIRLQLRLDDEVATLHVDEEPSAALARVAELMSRGAGTVEQGPKAAIAVNWSRVRHVTVKG